MIKIKGLEGHKYSDYCSKIVTKAMDQYDIDVKSVKHVGFYTNGIFRVETVEGINYALKVASNGWRTDDDLKSEAVWLKDLATNSDIGVPEPYQSKSGEYLISVKPEGIEKHNCMLMSWLDGEMFHEHLNSENLIKMGEVFAKLHNFSQNYNPPKEFTTRKMSKVLAREESDMLFSEDNESNFTPEQLKIYNSVKEKVLEAYAKLYADSTNLMVINHDLHHENIIIDSCGKLRPFDFEDTVWGYPVQDIAMAMKDLMEETKPEEFIQFLADFRRGYETLREWPEKYDGEMDLFMAGRVLWVENWMVKMISKDFRKVFHG